MTTAFGQSTVLGYPRIGVDRELKKAVEAYWAGTIDVDALESTAAGLRAQVWRTLHDARLDAIPSNTFSYYDQVLDTAVAVGAIPTRFARLGLPALDTYFAMARGVDTEPALELTKWFDTNYHYLVPEIAPDTVFTANPAKALGEHAEARDLGITTRPVFIGPATFLLLAKGDDPFARLDDLVDTYAAILTALAEAGVAWIQLDEPAYVADRTPAEIDALRRAYIRLGELTHRPRIFVATYFGDLGAALPALLDTPVEAIGLDLVAGPGNLDRLAAAGPLAGRTIVAGLVDGRNIWRTDLRAAIAAGATVAGLADHVAVATSCSLLHVPVDLSAETRLDPRLAARLAFARQKVDEVVLLGRALRDGTTVLPAPLPPTPAAWHHDSVRGRLAALRPADRQRGDYPVRAARQQDRLRLPQLPTTTIGSFPQTTELRKARAAHRAGRLDDAGYASRMRAEVEHVIRLQERWGLDVLVHGEPERNDMVQYFGEQLDGFAATEHGWVQSYGSRCVRPPIIYGDVARRAPMTVEWSTYAQSLTSKPVKGMLTGPVTILAWSFVRTDQPVADTADQVALALRDECRDLESAGIRVIQVDEPALRETLPLRKADQKAYLDWAVGAFRLATSGVADDTQIHTHLCYSEFGEVITAIDALDADVTSIEASRSKMEILDDLAAIGYRRGVGPGVWDIHSPRVPPREEMVEALHRAVAAVPARRLWVNPDCGLKTRSYPEVEASLRHLVAAAAEVRGH
ncbi:MULTISPECIES: 5-methyltetrahydropteroyltriglutamate--homocysteine S-methyltransferase [Micromonospora]|uniref:5-methyltetrahydropteroyltriglutamate--homocysteine methyltransferase n=2 Tax=Micromonospora TaxID=1873 RepID=A0A9X0HZH2_9ACTN|nr:MULTISPECIES: 5-methyltetrahydropteroyltriglutamate--homocysteine S-methyltransferase [Micromonospora]AEB44537.1 5-methyltetrahydropteroyltriglutamate--homocysteine S-methyltransferase [Micromonospora maris AB-18-032]AIS85791.1 5-methyltetrahydropteroyltriglutamate--homocysteine S-methyltransferase [Verrucosispora sp. MS100047]KUJ44045.1 5-methyltetrahydropteroyltriglutamate--homocysteine methyltransferase [Micromonospora maris]RUL89817.1 5-methyltetrahydropteroyltriglutamate--homocysteine S